MNQRLRICDRRNWGEPLSLRIQDPGDSFLLQIPLTRVRFLNEPKTGWIPTTDSLTAIYALICIPNLVNSITLTPDFTQSDAESLKANALDPAMNLISLPAGIPPELQGFPGQKHKKQFICPEPDCNYATHVKYHFIVHERTHTGERPYPCHEIGCYKSFARKDSLLRHQRTHRKKNPFKVLRSLLPKKDEPACSKPLLRLLENQIQLH